MEVVPFPRYGVLVVATNCVPARLLLMSFGLATAKNSSLSVFVLLDGMGIHGQGPLDATHTPPEYADLEPETRSLFRLHHLSINLMIGRK